jgi:hypothetical protein
MDNTELPEVTYGEKAVGLTFNPSKDETVDKVKKLYAEIIDICASLRTEAGQGEKGACYLSQSPRHRQLKCGQSKASPTSFKKSPPIQ